MSNRKIQQNNKIQCYVHPDADLIDDYVTGSIVCPLCGLVVVDRVIDLFIDSRDYSHEDQRLIRSCVGSPENYLLHSYSNLSTHIKPRRDDQLTHKEISEGLKLKYANLQFFEQSERDLLYGFDEIACMADRINLPKIIIDRAKYLLKSLNEKKCLKGRSHHARATACLYIACRQENSPRTYKEICAISLSNKKEIGKCFKIIVQALRTTVQLTNPCDLILRFSGLLNLSANTKKAALFISKKLTNSNQLDGRSPVSIAATAIYLACEITDNVRNEEEICRVCGISVSTLNKINKILEKSLSFKRMISSTKIK